MPTEPSWPLELPNSTDQFLNAEFLCLLSRAGLWSPLSSASSGVGSFYALYVGLPLGPCAVFVVADLW